MNRVQLITEQRRLLLGEQMKETAVHSQHCLALVEDPKNAEALEAVAASKAALAAIRNRLEIFDAAISGAEVRDAEDAQAARLAAAVDARNSAADLDARRTKEARAIDKTLTTLKEQLAAFVQTSQELQKAAHTVGKNTLIKTNPRYFDELSIVSGCAAVNIASPLAKGLIDAGAETLAGLGALHGYVGSINANANVEYLTKLSGDRLLDRLDLLLRKGA